MAHYVSWIGLCLTGIWRGSQTGGSKKVAVSLIMLRLIGSVYTVLSTGERTAQRPGCFPHGAAVNESLQLGWALLGVFFAVGTGFSMNAIAPWRPNDLEVNEYAIKRSSLVYHRLSLFDVIVAWGCHGIIPVVQIRAGSHACLWRDVLWINAVFVRTNSWQALFCHFVRWGFVITEWWDWTSVTVAE